MGKELTNAQNLEAPCNEHSQAKLDGLIRQKEKHQGLLHSAALSVAQNKY